MVRSSLITEDDVWNIVKAEDLWVLDKLIVSRLMEYACGPVGMDVPKPGWYIVRPCVNMIGLGMGAKKMWLSKDTMHLPLGFFWCEWFEGRHVSVDYVNGKQTLAVEGILNSSDDLTKWSTWFKVKDEIPLPKYLYGLADRYETINVEYIEGRVIEVHLRGNPDFEEDISEFIPDFGNSPDLSSSGYRYILCPEDHGRIGAWVK